MISLAVIIGLLAPRALYWPFVILTIAAFPIGWIVTQLMLALMFYCILTPLALVFRWGRRDPLQLRGRARASFWDVRDKQPSPEKYLKEF